MTAAPRRTVTAALVAAAALLGLLVAPGAPVGAEEPDVPYFTEYTGAEVTPPDTGGSPVVGHFTDQVLDDILWYAPGAPKEHLWTPCPDCESGIFTKKQLPLANQIGGYYEPIVGDFSGSGLDDIYWLNRSSSADYLWTSTGAGSFSVRRFDAPGGELQPLVLTDSGSGDSKDDILWRSFDPGVLSRLWVYPDDGSGTARTKARMRVPAGEALVGDYDGNGAADILFYPHTTPCRCPTPSAPSSTDTLWRRASGTGGTFAVTTMNIKGEYAPLVGRFSGQGDARDDILWVGRYSICCSPPTDRPDSLWEGRANGAFTASSQSFPSPGGGIVLGHDVADTALISDSDETRVWLDTSSGPVVRPVGSQVPPYVAVIDPIIGRFVSADRADLYVLGFEDEPTTLYHPVS
ncbi:hypothetical protein ACE2AJ_06275 [Aquihabitans daechungensis]|uniref:hypothetical protein n=1 Tax=Aquihabitans daechungensis TaxID=1052257 RepID=UPI003B9DDA21